MKSNVFEAANARDMDAAHLASEFIWTDTFDRLFTKRNHVVLGARGSGKTALAKMLTLEGLASHNEKRAREIIESKSFVATYLPLKAEFTTKLAAVAESYQDIFFVWSMNLSSCSQFISTIKACLEKYTSSPIDRVKAEAELAKELGSIWLDQYFDNLEQLKEAISIIEYKKNYTFNKVLFGFDLTEKDHLIGERFHSDLFSSFKMGIEVLKRILKFDCNATWAICIDEAEILEEKHWKMLNTQMRTYSDITFKITTMPYKHKTLKTLTGEHLNAKHDFEYIYLDRLGTTEKSQLAADRIIQEFAINLFDKKIANSSLKDSGITLRKLLGKSDLTDNSVEILPTRKLIEYVDKYCNEKTRARAAKLIEMDETAKFSNEIERKIRPLLIIKDYFESTTGQAYAAPKVYSGYDVAIKCCDGNPRKLISLFNRLMAEAKHKDGYKPLDKGQQGRLIKNHSTSELDSIKAEKNGFKAAELLTSVGNYFKRALHNEKIGTDINLSFEFDMRDDSMWESIRIAVDLGLLLPQITTGGENDSMPVMAGVFHFSGSISPHFSLPPRRGGQLKLHTILNRISSSSLRPLKSTFNSQLGLFDD